MSIDYCHQLSPSLPTTPTASVAPPGPGTSTLPQQHHHIMVQHLISNMSNSNNNNSNNSTSSSARVSPYPNQNDQNETRSSNSSSRQPPPPPPRMSTTLSSNSHESNKSSSNTSTKAAIHLVSNSRSSVPQSQSNQQVSNGNSHQQLNELEPEHHHPHNNRLQANSSAPFHHSDSPVHHSSSELQTGTHTQSSSVLTSSGFTTPPIVQWAKDFRHLISDPEGVILFKSFLTETIQNCWIVDFYFACESFHCLENSGDLGRLARAILRRFINDKRVNTQLGLSAEVKDHLVRTFTRLPKTSEPEQSNQQESTTAESCTSSESKEFDDNFYRNLFNDAKREAYSRMSEKYFTHFISSRTYLDQLNEATTGNHIDGHPIVYSNAHNAEKTPSPRNETFERSSVIDYGYHEPPTYESATGNANANYPNDPISPDGFRPTYVPLPTLDEITEHDDSMSNIEEDAEVSQTMAQATQATQSSQRTLKRPTSTIPTTATHGGNTSSTEYFDSGISSISGVEGRMSSLSLAHVSSRGSSTTSGQTRYQRSQSPIVLMNSNVQNRGPAPYQFEGGITYQQLGGGAHQPITLNQRMLKSYYDSRHQISCGKPAPNPYHISYSTVIPNSARDSEIQSISSNSTSESYSALVYNGRGQLRSVGGKPINGQRPSGLPRSSSSGGAPNPNQINKAINALRNEQGPSRPDPTQEPDQFAKLLVQKLNELVERHRGEKRMFQQLRQIDSDSSSSLTIPSTANATASTIVSEPVRRAPVVSSESFGQGLKDAFKMKRFDFGPPERETDCQSILDKHCAQVFDATPTNSGTPNTNAQQAAAAAGHTQSQPQQQQTQAHPAQLYDPNIAAAQQQQRYHQQQQYQQGHRGAQMSQIPGAYLTNGHHYHPNQQPMQQQHQQNHSRSHLPPRSPSAIPQNATTIGNNAHFNFVQPHPPPIEQISVTVRFADEDLPYLLNIPGPDVRLRNFKKAIPPKKGKYQYYFKREATKHEQKEQGGAQFMQELIEDDDSFLPLCKGKIFATAHQVQFTG